MLNCKLLCSATFVQQDNPFAWQAFWHVIAEKAQVQFLNLIMAVFNLVVPIRWLCYCAYWLTNMARWNILKYGHIIHFGGYTYVQYVFPAMTSSNI